MAGAAAAAGAGAGSNASVTELAFRLSALQINDPLFAIPESVDALGKDPLWERLRKLEHVIAQDGSIRPYGFVVGELVVAFGGYIYPARVRASELVQYGKEALQKVQHPLGPLMIAERRVKAMGMLLEGLVDDAGIKKRIEICWAQAIKEPTRKEPSAASAAGKSGAAAKK